MKRLPSAAGRRHARGAMAATRLLLLGITLGLSVVGTSARAQQPPRLTGVKLAGAPPQGEIGRHQGDGAFLLRAAGRDRTDAEQEGSLAAIETDAPAFTFSCRIARMPTETPDPQFGISIRAGTDGTEKCVNLVYDGREAYRCFRWWMRHHVTPSSHDGSGRAYLLSYDRAATQAEGLHLKIVRRYPYVFLYTSDNGETWNEFGADYLKVLLPQRVWVGPMLTAGGDGTTTASLLVDRVAFQLDDPAEPVETQAAYREYRPPTPVYRMFVAKVEPDGRPDRAFSPFLLMPKDMDPRAIRAILWSAGSKEMTVGGAALKFESGEGRLRRPEGLASWEGRLDLNDVHPLNQMLTHYGIVHVGGYFPPEGYADAVQRLAEISGIAWLPNVPMVITGASFAGGYTAAGAARYPERTIAAAPTLIGMAGANTDDPAVLRTPHLHVIGSRDGGHLKDALHWAPILRERGALWGQAPMWRVYHRQHKSFGLIFPYFLDCIDLRVPAGADYAKGPVRLRTLSENSGYYGLIDTWETNFPQVSAVREYRGDSKNLAWLPTQHAARLWQAFCSENPKTIIHFPMFEGHHNYLLPDPHGWHNSFLAAEEPFEVVASGRLGEGLAVEYYAGLKRLKVLRGENYRVTLEGLPPGLHAIYAITTLGEEREISRPVTVMFQRRSGR